MRTLEPGEWAIICGPHVGIFDDDGYQAREREKWLAESRERSERIGRELTEAIKAGRWPSP